MDIQLGSILESACAMAGYDLQYQAVPVRWRVTAAAAVNEGLRRIHAEKFPALRRIEFRRYRPTVADLEAALPTFSEGQECWYAGFYWRRTETYWERVPSLRRASGFSAHSARALRPCRSRRFAARREALSGNRGRWCRRS